MSPLVLLLLLSISDIGEFRIFILGKPNRNTNTHTHRSDVHVWIFLLSEHTFCWSSAIFCLVACQQQLFKEKENRLVPGTEPDKRSKTYIFMRHLHSSRTQLSDQLPPSFFHAFLFFPAKSLILNILLQIYSKQAMNLKELHHDGGSNRCFVSLLVCRQLKF